MREKPTEVKARLNDDGTVTVIEPDGTTHAPEPETDWTRIDAMSGDEVWTNAVTDPDSGFETQEELNGLWAAHIRKMRESTGLTQSAFAAQFCIPLGTLRDWEQGASRPDAAARAYLRVIAREPDAVKRALAS